MEVIILIILLALVIIVFRKFSSFVYGVAIIDIALRILEFIKYNINIKEVMTFINKYCPSSVLSVINKNTSGTINDILAWAYVAIMSIFLFYTIKTFIKKKK